ncbi:bacteriocin leader domain-containing protein [Bacillus halotolerans]|uniref:bacteriocin leader domain-containing protein n=1 Tax=Bacillus halotolerans TaxID=260554 RepID=UPI001D0F220B|nr:bacteriocin leader domain-containing protein [Bacillus halotolerans]MCC2527454.1 bacteriocin leader domain-containing protein [Bacillus halotolerans]
MLHTIENSNKMIELSEQEMLNTDGGGWRDLAGAAAGAAVMGGTAIALGAAAGPVGFAAGVGMAILTRPGHAR